jgi:hypothetical protein
MKSAKESRVPHDCELRTLAVATLMPNPQICG